MLHDAFRLPIHDALHVLFVQLIHLSLEYPILLLEEPDNLSDETLSPILESFQVFPTFTFIGMKYHPFATTFVHDAVHPLVQSPTQLVEQLYEQKSIHSLVHEEPQFPGALLLIFFKALTIFASSVASYL